MAIKLPSRIFLIKYSLKTFLSVVLLLLSQVLQAQKGAEVDLEKPTQYENRKLASEKTGDKKFTVPRRFIQNTTTHYNYYFNANNRLNEVIERAKSSFKDDYSMLLPYYNYTLQATAQDKSELDSVIYKSTAGILLHDLRSDWVDNMYLLMGKAYLFRNDMDSATMTLQYLNYAFAPKEEGGYDIPIGSNSSNETGEFSISTKEKRTILKKLTSRPPSRNEGFIWQIRAFIEHDELPEAAGLIEILKHDPHFPERLETDLHEVIGLWFYKQEIYDSAAFHLSKALSEASNKQEKARWEYLIGQMYQLTGNNELAVEYYNRSISHTIDPVMDVYARLNALKINRGDKKDYQQENIDALIKMAKRDKYANYRDIIYYAAATIELDRKKYDEAETLLLKSVKNNFNNLQQRSESFLLLADMNYDRKKYTPSANYYDSTDINSLKTQVQKDRVLLRKPPLKIVAANELVIYTQDSLQALAKLPADKRDEILKKKIKELKKIKGIKEEDIQSQNPAILQKQVPDLFGDNSKGNDFYFYNPGLKTRGFSEFRSKWGQRPNVDNWRRLSAINKQTITPGDVDEINTVTEELTGPLELSYEGLLSNIPLTEEKLASSNDDIEKALYTLGSTFQSKMEDYPSAIFAYEELLRRFPGTGYKAEALFNLIYAYKKTGDNEKSNQVKRQLENSADTSRFAQLIKNPDLAKKDIAVNAPATRKYEQIYNLFIEGEFEKAKQEKKEADKVYGKTFWTPQLLFIESIYYIREKEDTTAISLLTDLKNNFGTNPMAEKATTMIDVLKRRSEIEDYLTKLEVTRKTDEPLTSAPIKERVIDKIIITEPKILKDTVKTPVLQPAKPVTTPVIDQQKPITLPVVKETVIVKGPVKDSVIVQPKVVETKNEIEVIKPPVTLIEKPVKDTATPPVIPINKPILNDTATKEIIAADKPKVTDTIITPEPTKKETIPAAPVIVVKGFEFIATDPHYVVVVLDKVDQVYASEAKNAFNRFNKERYYNKTIEVGSLQLDDRFNMVLEGPFTDANAAVEYIDNVRPQTRSRILPWLNTDKYSFLIISGANLEVLKTNKDMTAYKQLIDKAFPNKF